MRIEGHEAILAARQCGLPLSKYADPLEGERQDLSVEEAQEIAREDPRLVYLDTDSNQPIVRAIEEGLAAAGNEADWDAPEFERARVLTSLAGCQWDWDGWPGALSSLEYGILGGVQFRGEHPYTDLSGYNGL